MVVLRREGDRQRAGRAAFAVAVVALLASTVALLLYAQRTPEVPGAVVDVRFLEAPNGLPASGSYVESEIRPDDSVHVTHWIRTTGTMSRIALEAPDLDPGAGADAPRATEVVVVGDGVVVARRATVDTAGRSFYFSTPARLVHISYDLAGAVERSSSADGRALARLTALTVDYAAEEDASATVRVVAPDVLSLACTEITDTGAQFAPRPCGKPARGAWEVVLRGADRDDSVSAQVNLGEPVRAGSAAAPARTR